MPFHRTRRRSISPRSVVQSFKKVLNYAGTSQVANTQENILLSSGTDSAAAGQTGPTDANVPTGSVIKGFIIQYSSYNTVNVAAFTHIAIQLKRGTQSFIDPRLVGGNTQRNQVFKQKLWNVAPNTNSNHAFMFKIPRGYQRVREGDVWSFSVISDQIVTRVVQVIYKFFR